MTSHRLNDVCKQTSHIDGHGEEKEEEELEEGDEFKEEDELGEGDELEEAQESDIIWMGTISRSGQPLAPTAAAAGDVTSRYASPIRRRNESQSDPSTVSPSNHDVLNQHKVRQVADSSSNIVTTTTTTTIHSLNSASRSMNGGSGDSPLRTESSSSSTLRANFPDHLSSSSSISSRRSGRQDSAPHHHHHQRQHQHHRFSPHTMLLPPASALVLPFLFVEVGPPPPGCGLNQTPAPMRTSSEQRKKPKLKHLHRQHSGGYAPRSNRLHDREFLRSVFEHFGRPESSNSTQQQSSQPSRPVEKLPPFATSATPAEGDDWPMDEDVDDSCEEDGIENLRQITLRNCRRLANVSHTDVAVFWQSRADVVSEHATKDWCGDDDDKEEEEEEEGGGGGGGGGGDVRDTSGMMCDDTLGSVAGRKRVRIQDRSRSDTDTDSALRPSPLPTATCSAPSVCEQVNPDKAMTWDPSIPPLPHSGSPEQGAEPKPHTLVPHKPVTTLPLSPHSSPSTPSNLANSETMQQKGITLDTNTIASHFASIGMHLAAVQHILERQMRIFDTMATEDSKPTKFSQ